MQEDSPGILALGSQTGSCRQSRGWNNPKHMQAPNMGNYHGGFLELALLGQADRQLNVSPLRCI